MTLDLPRTAMAVTIDIGDSTDIHPKNKQEVGRRLSLALKKLPMVKKLFLQVPYTKECLSREANAGCCLTMWEMAWWPEGVEN